jgi:hypothetical protein
MTVDQAVMAMTQAPTFIRHRRAPKAQARQAGDEGMDLQNP